MAKRFCCPECFDDRALRDQLFPSLDPSHGTCDFCGTADTQLVEPSRLANYFELLVNVYEPSDEGRSLVEWMKDDWLLFSHQRMDVAHAKDLLGEILDDGQIVRRGFVPSASYISEGLAQWDKLRDEMMYGNRWFLNVAIDEERLRRLLEMLIAKNLTQQWYRARIRIDEEAFPIAQMGRRRSDVLRMEGPIQRVFRIFILGRSLRLLLLRSGLTPANLLVSLISRFLKSRPWTCVTRGSLCHRSS